MIALKCMSMQNEKKGGSLMHILVKFGELQECEIESYYLYDAEPVLTEDEVLDLEPDLTIALHEIKSSYGVSMLESGINADEMVYVSLFDNIDDAKNYCHSLVTSTHESKKYSTIVSGENEKRSFLEDLMEKEIFNETGLVVSVRAKSAQNDEYEYQIYDELGQILLVDKFESTYKELKVALELAEELGITSLEKKRQSFGFDCYLEIENENGDDICITLSPAIQHSTNRNYLAMFKNQIIKEFAELS